MLSTIVVAGLLAASIALGPPPTEVRTVVDKVHGFEIADDYRWLESLEAEDESVRQWTTLQNDYTRGVLDAVPGRRLLEERLEALMTLPDVGSPTMRMNRYFYREREGSQNQAVLYLRHGFDGARRAILDPNAIDEKGLTSLDWYAPNHDGTLLAFGLSEAGDENSTLHVLDVDADRWLAEEIPGKVRGIDWLPDSTGFFYRDLADIGDPYSGRIRFHRLGTHHRHDNTLFEQYEGSTTWGPFASTSTDARWMILGYYTSTKSNDLWVVDLDLWFRSGRFEPRDIIVGDDSSSSGPVFGDTLFMRTTNNAPNGRVVAVDLNDPLQRNWTEIIPERSHAALRGVSLARGRLVASYLKSAATTLEQFSFTGESLGTIELPGIGSAGITTAQDRTEAFISFSSYSEPPTIRRIDLATGSQASWHQLDVPGYRPTELTVTQKWYPSADGTNISMFLVHRKNLVLDGDNPTVLYGYGGFNIPMTPRFSVTRLPFLEAGGVYAVANLRGGGEYGESWHEAGMLDRKQNCFDDCIAAAEYLVAQGYTTSDRLVVMGGSNGGLLVGAMITQRPDLFSGAICAVPLLDMLRYDRFLMAKYWVPEYGDPAVEEQFRWLHAYSPYHNVKQGVRYPAILLTAGENDSRVHPLHARKMAARLQSLAANDFDAEPVLLWVERSAGHGSGKPLRLRIRSAADQWAFIMWQTGIVEGPVDAMAR